MSTSSSGAEVSFGGLRGQEFSPPLHVEQQIIGEDKTQSKIREQGRANASLPVGSWEQMDDAAYRAETDTLTLVADLRAAGLVSDADITEEELTWMIKDFSHDATVSMSPETETDEGATTYEKDGTALPIIHSDYSIGPRVGEKGTLEADNAYGASWTVNSRFEYLVLYGWKPTVGMNELTGNGYSLYGMTNHPAVGGGTIRDWSTNPTYARQDIRNMVNQIRDEQNHAPGNQGFWLYLGSDLDDRLDDLIDPADSDSPTIRDRLQGLSGLGRMEMTESLDPKGALMFRPTPDVVDLAIAEDLQTLQWNIKMRENYKVMLSGTPRIKQTVSGNTGIAYWSSTGGA